MLKFKVILWFKPENKDLNGENISSKISGWCVHLQLIPTSWLMAVFDRMKFHPFCEDR